MCSNYRKVLIASLENYQSLYSDEEKYKSRFLDLLQHPLAFKRELLHAHITGSAWIVNKSFDNVLLIHHRKLDRWLQPGGHTDGHENVFEVAAKEVFEETGIQVEGLAEEPIFDIDIHVIPERKEVPEHEHFDIRYLFAVDENVLIKGNHESNAIRWFDLEDIPDLVKHDQSVVRMVDKTKVKKSLY